jgi:hypothetical protein
MKSWVHVTRDILASLRESLSLSPCVHTQSEGKPSLLLLFSCLTHVFSPFQVAKYSPCVHTQSEVPFRSYILQSFCAFITMPLCIMTIIVIKGCGIMHVAYRAHALKL